MRMTTLIPAGLCLALVAAGAAAKTTSTVLVDCDKGEGINKALEDKADELIVEIRGMCQEKVTVTRGNVTLRGADPALDGVTGPALDPDDPNDRALVTILGTIAGVRFESLAFTGSAVHGMEVLDGAIVNVENCRLTGNGRRGLEAGRGALAYLTDSTISDNGERQLKAYITASVICTRCTITATGSGRGALATQGGYIAFVDSTITVPHNALVVAPHATIWADETDVFSGQWAALISESGHFRFSRGEFAGSLFAESQSELRFWQATQTSNPVTLNFIERNAFLELNGSALVGTTYLNRFANGTADSSSTLEGLICDSGADFFCESGVTGSFSSCGQCPLP